MTIAGIAGRGAGARDISPAVARDLSGETGVDGAGTAGAAAATCAMAPVRWMSITSRGGSVMNVVEYGAARARSSTTRVMPG